jgi:hypothetical protein
VAIGRPESTLAWCRQYQNAIFSADCCAVAGLPSRETSVMPLGPGGWRGGMVFFRSLLNRDNRQAHTSMSVYYSLFGLLVEADRPIPGLVARRGGRASDVRLWLDVFARDFKQMLRVEREAWYESPDRNESNEPILRAWRLAGGAAFHWLYQDGTEFIFDSTGTEVWALSPERATLADTATYVLGPVLGFVLRLRGMTCLHASAVAVGEQAVAFLGPAGAGKSTTAAAFASHGHPVLSDDITVLHEDQGAIIVQPGYPHLRLWPDSVSALFGSPEALPRLTPDDGINSWWDKRYLDLCEQGYPFQAQPLPLAAIYLLGQPTTSPRAPYVEPVAAHPGLISLVANTYTNYMLDTDMRRREFELLGRALGHVPLRRLTPRTEPACHARLCALVREDVTGLTAAPVPD